MNLRLRRWIALLALLLVPVTGSAASLCVPAASGAAGSGAEFVHGAHGGHPHHGGEERRTQNDGRPSSPVCALGMTAGAGCLGGYLAPATAGAPTDGADRPAFAPPVEARPRIAAVSLFRPPRA